MVTAGTKKILPGIHPGQYLFFSNALYDRQNQIPAIVSINHQITAVCTVLVVVGGCHRLQHSGQMIELTSLVVSKLSYLQSWAQLPV